MIAEFEAPLQAMIRPDNRRYQEPEAYPSSPSPADLSLQLEGLWPGLDKLPEYRKRALHQLVSRIRRLKAHDSKWSFLTLGASMPLDDLDVFDEPVVPIQGKPSADQKLQAAELHFDADSIALIDEAVSRHAFTATVCIALIKRAKQTSGILPSSDFLWAREKDLHFWRMINGYGRLRHKPEVVGAFAHFDLECRQNKPISTTRYFGFAEFEA